METSTFKAHLATPTKIGTLYTAFRMIESTTEALCIFMSGRRIRANSLIGCLSLMRDELAVID